jgi:hypothetical protein
MNRQLLAALAASLLAACAAKDTQPVAKADPPFVFPHTPHLEGDVDCKFCHGTLLQATKLEIGVRHAAIPVKNQEPCSGCHDDAEFKAKISKLAVPVRTRTFAVRMNHAAHLAKPGVTCATCHKKTPETGDKEPVRLEMGACTACHKHQMDFDQGKCLPCHVDLKRYEKPVAAFRHAGDFLKTHGQLAKPTAESCASCHEQTFCADCHSATTAAARPSVIFPEDVQRDLIHRGDWVSRHMIDAEANPASCRKCHGSKYCDTCHTAQNFTLSNPNPRNPHPPGWATKGSGDFHGFAARKNIVLCAGCHDNGADAVCVVCHKVGGLAGSFNPHPKSWNKKTADIGKTPMCAICHG